MNFRRLSIALLAACGLFCPCATATRRSSRRSDIQNVPPLSQTGYTVPQPCVPGKSCVNKLPDPPANQTLQYLALARGVGLYSCKDRTPGEEPLFQLQSTTLWDAAPLVPRIKGGEAAFHLLVPQLLHFDYGALLNSSLICIGMITTIETETIIELYDVGKIAARVRNSVKSPDPPRFNYPWTLSTSYDLSWNIYRVKTYLGEPLGPCEAGQEDSIQTEYAAEYWFYR